MEQKKKKFDFWIVAVIFVAIGIRILFRINFGSFQVSPDSNTYYGMDLSKSLVNSWRTPGYPLLLSAIYAVNRIPMPSAVNETNAPGASSVVIAQQASGVIVVCIIYMILAYQLGLPRVFSGLACIFIACQKVLLINEFSLMTEAFSTLWLTGLVYMAISQYKIFHPITFVLVGCYAIIGFLLRPAFIGLPCIIFGLQCLHHRRESVYVLSVILCFLYVCLLNAYILENSRVHSYAGITRAGDVNVLEKIFTYNLPTYNGPEADGVRRIVEAYRYEYHKADPWPLFDTYHPKLLDDHYANAIHIFSTGVVLNNLGKYIRYSIETIPNIVSEPYDNALAANGNSPIFRLLASFYRAIQPFAYILFLSAPCLIYTYFKHRDIVSAGQLLLCMVGLYTFFVIAFFSSNQYGRLLSPAIPCIYSCCFLSMSNLIRYMYKYMTRKIFDTVSYF